MALLNRKGVAGFTDFVRIVFWVIVFAMFTIFIYAVAKSLMGGGVDRTSKQNFGSLADNVQLMIDKTSSFEYQKLSFYLKQESYIFGFMSAETVSAYNAGKNTITYYLQNDRESTMPFSISDYPKECQGKPCLCFYSDISKGGFASKPVQCKVFDNSVVFHGYCKDRSKIIYVDSFKSFILEIPKQDSSLYSDYPAEAVLDYCQLALDRNWFVMGESEVHNLYLEKYVKNGKTHILITPNLDETQINKRIAAMAECPSTSDPECLGKVVNSFVSVNPESYCFYDDNENKCVLKKEVTRCEVDKKVGKDCLCGDKYASAADHGGIDYCLKNKDAYALMPFLCSQITSCADYCKISDTAECIGEERTYCDEDFCTKGCQVDGSGKNVVCKNKA